MKDQPVTFQTVREIAIALPEVEEGTSYGTSAFKVSAWMFNRLPWIETAYPSRRRPDV